LTRIRIAALVAALLATMAQAPALGDQSAERETVRAFVSDMVDRHGLKRAEVERLMSRAEYQDSIITLISMPVTAKPWSEFRPLFVSPLRIARGQDFWEENAGVLSRARDRFGVPEEIVVAVIGVETLYGQHVGKHRVLDALYTLAFDYPPRETFFRGELENFLLFLRDSGHDAGLLKGSYAGAMGIPQFMPSSVRQYAVDFDADGRIDLWGSTADSIGSVANYLRTFGWQAGRPVMIRAELEGEGYRAILEEGYKPQRTLAELAARGIRPREPVSEDLKSALIRLEGDGGPEFWLVFDNFYAITRYNRSLNYATAVYQLAEEIKALYRAGS